MRVISGIADSGGIQGPLGKWTDVPNKKLVPNYEDSAHHGDRMVPLGEFRIQAPAWAVRGVPLPLKSGSYARKAGQEKEQAAKCVRRRCGSRCGGFPRASRKMGAGQRRSGQQQRRSSSIR